MSKGKVFLGIVAGLLVTYVAAAPYITVYQMKAAAERRDGEALSEHIDFPSVRQSIKDQLNANVAKEMAEDKNNIVSALGAAFAGVMVDKIVDVYVTPAGISQLMAGEKPEQGEDRSSDSITNERGPLSDSSMSYESLDKFVVKVKAADGEEGQFVLRRRGVGWKLTEIMIPFE